jgi:glycosyltransferase involved in cell wall biosynthesis
MPKVSVIMNCYNGGDFVRQAIESVYAQSFTDWEIIFWDNCSTDNSAEIAQSFDNRLRYFRSERQVPLGAARNFAMAKAEGDWIGFLDHDDLIMPHRFTRQMAAIGEGDYALCYAGMREIDEKGRVVRDVMPQHQSGNIFGELLANCDAFLQTTMINRRYMQQFDIRAAETYMLLEDVNIFLKLAARGPVCVVPEVVSIWRLLPQSLTETKKKLFPVEFSDLLNDLRCTNPGIEKRYPEAFRQAEARGCYYSARLEMDNGEYVKARVLLRKIRSVRYVYFSLYLLSFIPALWRFSHDRTVKARLTNFFLGRGKRKERLQ